MADDKPVVVRFADGAEYGVASIEVAQRVYPTAEIVRYQDGQPLEEAAAQTPNLRAMTRRQLNARAAELGVDVPDKLQNKAAVLAAIAAASAPAGTGESETDPGAGDAE